MSHALWQAVFGNAHPVEIEIGAGTGTFLLPAAAANRATNYFGIENARRRAGDLQCAIADGGLHNARAIHGDATCIVAHLVPAASVRAYHVYFPDPWWKRRHHRRRLFTPALAHDLARTLEPDGTLYVATDVAMVIEVVHATLAAVPAFALAPQRSSPRPGVTIFERKGLARGAKIYEAAFANRTAGNAPYTSSAAPMTPAESPS